MWTPLTSSQLPGLPKILPETEIEGITSPSLSLSCQAHRVIMISFHHFLFLAKKYRCQDEREKSHQILSKNKIQNIVFYGNSEQATSREGLFNLFFFILAGMWKWWQELWQPYWTMKWKPSLENDRTIKQSLVLWFLSVGESPDQLALLHQKDRNFWHAEVILNIVGGSIIIDHRPIAQRFMQ